MTAVELQTLAEQEAKKAEELEAFQDVKLKSIKAKVSEVLDLIGSGGIFDTYTKHDITHVNKMLDRLEWLIPEETQEEMTPADWLMCVISIYFHDMGLLVTKNEFNNKEDTNFQEYKNEHLYGDKSDDLNNRLEEIPEEDEERFLYQEFVRENHDTRIRDWIKGEYNKRISGSEETVNEINELVSDFPLQFQHDLAQVCESHHLKDLDDIEKYNQSQPYGDNEDSEANLQYCAVLLRSSDILHITRDRAPAIAFRIIDPSDPVGQQAWAKHESVSSVRKKKSTNPDEEETNTIEIHARFEEADAFFALDKYIEIIKQELEYCHEVISEAEGKTHKNYKFPWKKIDDTNIDAEGFEEEKFEFELDQENILDLLTGHTLYNSTGVVIRELVQNSIDAIRLKQNKQENNFNGKVEIDWNRKKEMVEISDNGTGMSQEIIEDYLLTVGSSRYQDPDFKEKHSNFNPISEFGIGILSTFMIADEVEIITAFTNGDSPRKILFREVSGRYLIQHLDQEDPEYQRVTPSGTVVKLDIRPDADIGNIKNICQDWFSVVPCDIELNIDNEETVEIGHNTLSDAVRGYVKDNIDSLARVSNLDNLDVITKEYDGIELCFAVTKSDYFDNLSFVTGETIRGRGKNLDPLGICVEGIRVTSSTPGYGGKVIVAMANLTGENRPRTNVARNDLKSDENYQRVLKYIYRGYNEHIRDEIDRIYENKSYSLSWAVNEVKHLERPLKEGRAEDSEQYYEERAKVPSILIEKEGKREAISKSNLAECNKIWTIDSPLLRRANRLFVNLPVQKSYKELINDLDLPLDEIPSDPLICEYRSLGLPRGLSEREPIDIQVLEDDKRIDIGWAPAENNWAYIDFLGELQQAIGGPIRNTSNLFIQKGEIDLSGISDINILDTVGGRFYLNSEPYIEYMNKYIPDDKFSGEQNGINLTKTEETALAALWVLDHCIQENNSFPDYEDDLIRLIENDTSIRYSTETEIEFSKLKNKFEKSDWREYSPNRWFKRVDELQKL
jgi:hypothetical protein